MHDLVFLANNFEWAASTIAELYKARWQVELLFKDFWDFWGQALKRVVVLLCYYVIFEITRFYLSKGHIRIPIVNQAARTSRSEGEVRQNAQSLPLRTHTPGHHASNSPEPRQSSRPATSTRNGGPSAEHSAAPA